MSEYILGEEFTYTEAKKGEPNRKRQIALLRVIRYRESICTFVTTINTTPTPLSLPDTNHASLVGELYESFEFHPPPWMFFI